MKQALFIAAITFMIFSSCKKQCPAVGKSSFDYLIAHSWKYDKYYIGYTSPSNLGTLAYQRGRQTNTVNLDNDVSAFYADGTVDEIDQSGNHVPGTWQFGNKEMTLIIVKNSFGTFNTRIVLLDDNHFDWYYPASDGTNRYGEYIPK